MVGTERIGLLNVSIYVHTCNVFYPTNPLIENPEAVLTEFIWEKRLTSEREKERDFGVTIRFSTSSSWFLFFLLFLFFFFFFFSNIGSLVVEAKLKEFVSLFSMDRERKRIAFNKYVKAISIHSQGTFKCSSFKGRFGRV